MEYIALGSWFLNDITFSDGRKMEDLMGGCGLFAYCGMLQYTPSALFLGAVGTDMEEKFGAFIDRNHISRQGFLVYPNRTTVARLCYEPDGQWNEEFFYGPRELGIDVNFHVPEMYERLEQVLAQGGTKGIYAVDKVQDEESQQRMRRMREKYGVKVMWELFTADCRAENLKFLVEKALPCYDIYSLNRTEGYTLFSVSTEEEVIQRILEIGRPCFFRAGSKGSYMIRDGHVAFLPTVNLVPREEEIDPTGCGNCSTAAALWAFCEGYDNYEIAAIANVAAAYNVQQYGPYPLFTEELRKQALEKALELAAQAREREKG